ncbi:glycosyltransferase [Polynucleobacter sp. MWH-Jannik1A5]|uniref:glycosyltransferase n=1 Tax=Polynucleobacter sp. MWH-Jannik1A5 TaxID=1855890 RepID=UPI001C0AC6D5|nr:glycosyltransferase [Polynucleobacter sp. MWH-Jannik1A5]MBU3546743.1 glycosyltransferase [Polynucleobacter sp. MWH-Jannik1A5]
MLNIRHSSDTLFSAAPINSDVVAVIVTFNSDLNLLTQSLESLVKQCVVFVIDNSTDIIFRDEIEGLCINYDVNFLALGANFGIGHAQNIGINWARKKSFTEILFMDDDSTPSNTLVADLLRARKLSPVQPAVVGARTISAGGEDLSNAKTADTNLILVPCNELTSSGALISMDIFNRVGVFDSRLFIDCVDFEWGWRAKSLGVPLFLSASVSIQHRLGVCTRFGLRLPTPIRHYYQYRNILRMMLFSKSPVSWRLIQLIKLPLKLVLIILIADRKFQRICYSMWGIRDFIAGRVGEFNH